MGKRYRVDYVPGGTHGIRAVKRDTTGHPVGCNGWNHPEGVMHGAVACPVHDRPAVAA